MCGSLWPLKIAVFDYIINAYMDSNDPNFMKPPDTNSKEEEEKGENQESDFTILLIIIEILIKDFEDYLEDKYPKTRLKYPNG